MKFSDEETTKQIRPIKVYHNIFYMLGIALICNWLVRRICRNQGVHNGADIFIGCRFWQQHNSLQKLNTCCILDYHGI
jgi:hypothetical protein